MTTPGNRYSDELPPVVTADGTDAIRTAAGTAATGRAFVTNRSTEARILAVSFLGVDADWLPEPTRSRVLMPGETVPMDFTLHPAVGTLSARYPFAITVQAIDPASGQAMSSAAIADYALVVDAPGRLEVQVVPNELTRRLRGKVSIKVTNVGNTAEDVRLEINAPENVGFSLADEQVRVQPGSSASVPVRIAIEPQPFGRPTRYSYTVTARGRGAARRTEAALTTRSIFGNTGPKFFAIVGIIALWAGLLITLVPTLVNKINESGSNAQDSVAQAQDRALDKLRKTQTATPTAGASSGGSGGSGNGGGSGGSGGGSGNGGSGGGSGSGGSGGSGGSANPSATGAQPVQFSGTVGGDAPAGVTVSMRPTSLVDEEAQSATGVGVNTSSFNELGKIPAEALTATTTAATAPGATTGSDRSTTTKDDGAWGFAKVTSPGYYLVTFAKPGFQSQRYVLDAASAAATEPLAVTLVPGKGKLGGRITGPNGPVGGATITLTDGTNTLASSSNSRGNIGSWSVDGLSTPGTYLVTASKDGLSTESTIVTLGAGGESQANLDLKRNSATLTGRVYGPTSQSDSAPLGNVSVTAKSEATERTSTTITSGNLAGTFRLPDLPAGDYVITTQAAGYLTQTRAITIKEGETTSSLRTDLRSATAVVTGVVKGVQFDTEGNVQKDANGTPVTGPVNGAGITLSNDTNKYKVTTGSNGAFRLDGVAPGSYVLSAEFAGLGTAYADVEVEAGVPVQVPIDSLQLPAADNKDSSSITGFVSSATNPSGAITCPTDAQGVPTDCDISLRLRNSSNAEIKTNVEDSGPYSYPSTIKPSATGPTPYSLYADGGLPAGVYRITVSVPGYLPTTVTVRVPANTVATAPTATLFPTNGLIGRVNSTGNLSTDGPISRSTDPAGSKQKPFTTCIVARPVSYDPSRPNTAPTSCTPPADTGACQTRAEAQEQVTNIDPSTQEYVLKGLCDGVYNVYAVTENPWYVNVTGPAQQTLFRGQTVSFSPTVARDGRVPLRINVVDPATGDERSASSSDFKAGSYATCGATADRSYGSLTALDSRGATTIDGVNSGSNVSCRVSATFADGTAINRTFTVGSVSNEQDSSEVVLTLTKPVGNLVGQLVTSYENKSNVPLADTQIAIAGTVADGNGTTGTGNILLYTDANGCFAITSSPGGNVNGTAGGPCASVSGTVPQGRPAGPVAYNQSLVSPFLTVSYSGDNGFRPLSDRLKFTKDTTTPVTIVADYRSTNNIKLGTTLNPDPDLSKATLTATAQSGQATGAGTITLSSDASGNLTWKDSKIDQNNAASPGKYTITASLTGFTSDSETLTCAFPGGKTFPSDSEYKFCTLDAGHSFELKALAEYHGTVYGVKGDTDTYGAAPGTAYAKDELPNATVTLTRCADDSATDPATCTGATKSTTTKGDGTFTFASASTAYTIDSGTYKVTIGAAKYDTRTLSSTVVLNGGDNTALSANIYRSQVTLTVKLQKDSTTPYTCKNKTCTVQLRRTDTQQLVSITQSDSGTFVFNNLNPATYEIQATGSGIALSSATTPVDSSLTYNLPVTTLSNSLSGTVNGLQGNSTTESGLNGVTVELGHLSNGSFVRDNTDEQTPLLVKTATQAGVAGKFTFPDVPKGDYVMRYNDPSTDELAGYKKLEPFTEVVSFPGVNQAQTRNPVSLQRITRTVAVTIDTTADADDVSTTAVVLRNSSDNTWTFSPSSTSAADLGATPGRRHTFKFLNVPFGQWTIEATLPGGHLGALDNNTGTPAMSCPDVVAYTATDRSPARKCTSANLTVSGDQTDTSDTAAGYKLDEFLLSFKVTGSKLANDPDATVPSTVALKIRDTDASGTPIAYGDDNYTVNGATRTTFWARSSHSYKSDVDSPGDKWQVSTETYSKSSPTHDIAVTERSATVVVSVSGLPAGFTAGSIVLTLGGNRTSTPASQPVLLTTDSVTFTSVPYVSGATARLTYTPAGGNPTTKSSAAFDIDSANESTSITGP